MTPASAFSSFRFIKYLIPGIPLKKKSLLYPVCTCQQATTCPLTSIHHLMSYITAVSYHWPQTSAVDKTNAAWSEKHPLMSPGGLSITLNPAETCVKPRQACEHDLGRVWERSGGKESEGRCCSLRHRQDKRRSDRWHSTSLPCSVQFHVPKKLNPEGRMLMS